MNHFITRITVLFLAALILCPRQPTQAQGVRFESSLTWEQILAKAKVENKYIFLDCYTTWCGPCKAMEKDIYPNQDLGDKMNDKFISVKLQMDKTATDDDRIKEWYPTATAVEKGYHINAYPSFLFFSPDGKLVHRGLGYKTLPAMQALATEAADAQKQFYPRYDRFKAKTLPQSEMPTLTRDAVAIGQPELAGEIARQYIDKFLLHLPEDTLYTKTSLSFIAQFTESTNSKGFDLFKNDSTRINAILGPIAAQRVLIRAIIKDRVQPAIAKDKDKDHPDWVAIDAAVTKKFGLLGHIAALQENVFQSYQHQDWKGFGLAYKAYYAEVGALNVFDVNEISWALFQKVSDPDILLAAAATMKSFIPDLQPYQIDTYANLLYRAGKTTEAIEAEERAVALDKENLPNLDKMKKGLPTWPQPEPAK